MDVMAGDLRHRVRIESYSPVLDTAGDPFQDPNTGEVTKSWQLLATVWAKRSDQGAREVFTAQQINPLVTSVFTIRYRSDMDPTMRLVHRGQFFNISGLPIDPDSGLEWLIIPVVSGINAGG